MTMKRTAILLATLLAACAHVEPQPIAPRDLALLVDQDGNKLLLQSVVTNCQAPWHRAVHTTPAGHSMLGCWRRDSDGSLVVDFEDGTRMVVPANQMQRRESQSTGSTT